MRKLLFLSLFLAHLSSWATHNRAGEITYRWLGGLTYEVTITTYARASVAADRCQLTLDWGDNSSSDLPRINGPSTSACNTGAGVVIAQDIRLNIYKGTHTYPSAGAYILSFQDPNRNAGVRNIPNSVNVPFYVQTELLISPAIGGNSSPILTNPPVDDGCLNRIFEHNPGAYDPDGDSLVYTLVPCRTTDGVIIPTTYDPQFVQDSIKVNAQTGDVTWDVPRNIGEYNMAIRIEEFRRTPNGAVRVGYVVRDMQVSIGVCNNNPPVVDPVGPFCVEAGTLLQIPVRASDPDYDSTVTLRAFGGPFEIQNPANPLNLTSTPTFLRDSIKPEVSGLLTWQTACNHVRLEPHYITLEARDRQRSREESDPLVDVYTFPIRVIGPSPKNPTAQSQPNAIDLNWDVSACAQAIGYKIYRRSDSIGFVPDSCETGVPGYTGYVQIGSTSSLTDTSFTDSVGLVGGQQYCYMVVACYPDGAESYASLEFCASLPLTMPLMAMADVQSTDPNTGSIDVRWIGPREIDSSVFLPPYRYELLVSPNNSGNFNSLGSFNSYQDTAFIHQNLNTTDSFYTYKVFFYSSNQTAAVSESAPLSSQYLRVLPTDGANVLRLNNQVPFTNERFVIYRENPTGSGQFDSIAESSSPIYIDTGLVNGDTYCYYVRAVGAYSSRDTLPAPFQNRSQIQCGTPIDTTRPCPPELTAAINCESDSLALSWTYPDDSLCAMDVVSYNVYFKATVNDVFGSTPLFSGLTQEELLLINQGSIVGCYAITAIDDASSDPGGTSNESALSNVICVEACPVLCLPNVFTPNGDGRNDRFLPVNFKDIGELQIEIFNRWGTRVFYSSDVNTFTESGWDGRDQSTGNFLADGVYFYTATYKPKSLVDVEAKVINGFVHLMR